MERFTVDQSRIDEMRTELETNYPTHAEPLAGTSLKLDDQVLWMDLFPCHVLWGYDTNEYFFAYCPEYLGDLAVPMQGEYITDRAPADPEETPMPIYPVQQQQQQRQPAPADKNNDKKKALQAVLKLIDHEHAKKVRELVRSKKPELLEKE